MDDDVPVTPRKRDARGNIIAKRKCCHRCVLYLSQLDTPECDGVFEGSTQYKSCARCRRGHRTDCAPVSHEDLMPKFNALLDARDTAAERRDTAHAEDAQTLLDQAQAAFNDALKMFHNNKSKVTGDERTPRGSRVSGPPAFSNGISGVEMQRIRRSGNTIAVAGRELVRHFCGDEAANSVTAALAGENEEDEGQA